MKGRPEATGFTLLEALVVLAIMVVVTAMAAELILAAQARLVISGRETAKPATESVLARLRADIQASSSFTGFSGTFWGSEPLVLLGHTSGYGIVYQAEDDGLQRSAIDLSTGEVKAGPQTVLVDVDSFRWRRHPDLSHAAVEVELRTSKVHQATARFSAGQVVASEHEHVFRMLIMPRRGARSWI